jgi:hypothetical protein
MKVFISWSGEPSRTVALALRDWFPSVIQSIEPYVSSEDIEKGAPWFSEIAHELNDTAFGLICVTRVNADSRWLNFEAGALFKSVKNIKSRVSPFLVDLKPTELVGPLAQLQTTEPSRDDVARLVKSFDSQSGQAIGAARVDRAITKWWPDLEKQLEAARKSARTQGEPERRSPQDMLEELLEATRGIQRSIDRTTTAGARVKSSANIRIGGGEDEEEGYRRKKVIDEVWETLYVAGLGYDALELDGNNLTVEVTTSQIPDDVITELTNSAERHGLTIAIVQMPGQ